MNEIKLTLIIIIAFIAFIIIAARPTCPEGAQTVAEMATRKAQFPCR